MIAGGIAVVVGIVGKIAISRVHIDPQADKEMHFNNVEKIFGILMISLRLVVWLLLMGLTM